MPPKQLPPNPYRPCGGCTGKQCQRWYYFAQEGAAAADGPEDAPLTQVQGQEGFTRTVAVVRATMCAAHRACAARVMGCLSIPEGGFTVLWEEEFTTETRDALCVQRDLALRLGAALRKQPVGGAPPLQFLGPAERAIGQVQRATGAPAHLCAAALRRAALEGWGVNPGSSLEDLRFQAGLLLQQRRQATPPGQEPPNHDDVPGACPPPPPAGAA
eukprot:gene2400-6500_t